MYAASEVAKACIPGEHSMESKQRNQRDGSKAAHELSFSCQNSIPNIGGCIRKDTETCHGYFSHIPLLLKSVAVSQVKWMRDK